MENVPCLVVGFRWSTLVVVDANAKESGLEVQLVFNVKRKRMNE